MSFELTQTERDNAAAVMRQHFSEPPSRAASTFKTIGLWVVLMVVFIVTYQHLSALSSPGDPRPPAERPWDAAALAALALCIGNAVVGLMAALVWRPPQVQATRFVGLDATRDGLELAYVKATAVIAWGAIERAAEGEHVILVRMKEKGVVWTLPKRLFDPARRDAVVNAIIGRAADREPDGIDADEWPMKFTRSERWLLNRLTGVATQRARLGALIASSLVASFALAALAMHREGWWILTAFLGVPLLLLIILMALRAWPRGRGPAKLRIGSAGLRVISDAGGTQVAWSQIESWRETPDLFIIRAQNGVLPVLRRAVPDATLRWIRERLPAQHR